VSASYRRICPIKRTKKRGTAQAVPRFKKAIVGAIIDRPQILQSKICRRKAKILSFSFRKSEKPCFSAGDQ
jgi:hypothetical protein